MMAFGENSRQMQHFIRWFGCKPNINSFFSFINRFCLFLICFFSFIIGLKPFVIGFDRGQQQKSKSVYFAKESPSNIYQILKSEYCCEKQYFHFFIILNCR